MARKGEKKHGKKKRRWFDPTVEEMGARIGWFGWWFNSPKYFRRRGKVHVIQSGWKSCVTLIGKPLEFQQDCFCFACINYDLTATTTVSWKIQNGNGRVPSKMKDFRELPEVSPQKDQMSITSPYLCWLNPCFFDLGIAYYHLSPPPKKRSYKISNYPVIKHGNGKFTFPV